MLQSAPQRREAPPLDIDIRARLAAIDQRRLRAYRLERLRAELRKRDYAACLLADPINIRYATGSRNLGIWGMHAPGRWAFVPAEGPVVLFEFPSSQHVNDGIETIAEIRPCVPWIYFLAGPRCEEKASAWAGEIAAMVSACGGRNRRLAVDRCEPPGALRLIAAGIELFDAQEPIEQARRIKSPEEIECHRLSMEVCDAAISTMRDALRPGITENQLWSILH